MDLPWGDEKTIQFITNVGLVTSNGPNGQNIMACEWTHHVSYSPGLIAVCIKPHAATNQNIKQTGQFGISITSTEQATLASVAGTTSAKSTHKIKALEELGFNFYKAKEIDTLMVEGAVLNIECKVIQTIQPGSHTIFIGEILSIKRNQGKKPLALHQGQYGEVTFNIPKPTLEQRAKIKEIITKNTK